MGTRRRRVLVGLLCMVAGLAIPISAAAKESAAGNDLLRKLGRGIANVATCPLELIRTPELVGRRDGYLAGMSVGILQGAFRTIARGLVGAFEVFTFYSERPNHYAPIMQPEFVWSHGNWSE